MHDAAAIQTINREQLATATDRLLLGWGRMPARRRSAAPARSARGSIPSIVLAAQVRSTAAPDARELPSIAPPPSVRGSHPHVIHRPLARGSQLVPLPARAAVPPAAAPHDERTVPGHRRAAVYPPLFGARR